MANQFVTDFSKLSKTSQHVAEVNAKQFGITPEEYIIMRGGVDPITHRYGDSYVEGRDLTPEEYTAAIAGKTGLAVGQAINAAEEAKTRTYNLKSGKFPNDLSSPDAKQLYEMFKGKATSGQKLTPEEQSWLDSYLTSLKTPTGNVSVTPTGNGSATPVASGTTSATTSGTTSGSPLDTTAADEKLAKRTSAYNTLYDEFNKYGLGSLVSDIKNYLIDNTFDPSEYSIQLQNTKAYQDRFSANKDRIAKGLTALRPADYIAMEDQYQNIMRNYGLPASYYAKGPTGVQEGFNQLIANDVDNVELEDRIMSAQQRVINANPEVLQALKQFYPDIKNGDILAYVLDPKNGKDMIKRKITAAEIGGAQLGAGLATSAEAADALRAAGVTKGEYEQSAALISEATKRGSQLADIYGQQPYTQQTAEAEYLATAGSADAAAKRKKLKSLEEASFSGSSGVGALGRDKAIYGAAQGQAGLY